VNYGYGDGSGEVILSTFFFIYFSILGGALLLGLIVYVLNGFALMKLFRKVGVEPWAAWVPFFNTWRILELGGQPGWLSLLVLVSPGAIVTSVFECIGVYKTSLAFRKSGEWVVLFIFLPFVWAWLLAADGLVYEPELIAQRGYLPPLVGYGSARGPYVPPPASTPPPATPGSPAA
jgi:hypothetical protein